MDREGLIDKLQALAQDDKARPKAARLRDVIEDVEATLASGVSRAKVLSALNEHGLDMTMKTFETTLKRIRAGSKRGNARRPAKPVGRAVTPRKTEPVITGQAAPVPAEPAQQASGSTPPVVVSPADIDQIARSDVDLDKLSRDFKKSQRKGSKP